MAQENSILKVKLKHKGYFNFKDLYEFCFGWLQDAGYMIAEKEYSEKISGPERAISIEWEASKEVTDYFKYKMKVGFEIEGLSDAEVEEEGKKIKTNKGSLKISFGGTLIRDKDSEWEKKPVWKIMRGIYDKYIIKTTAEERAGKLAEDVTDFVEEVKAFLNLATKS